MASIARSARFSWLLGMCSPPGIPTKGERAILFLWNAR
jgi:hypothetical protein